MSNDIRITSGDGVAHAVFDGIDLLPIDDALGTTGYRAAHDAANADGAALYAALRTAEAEWTSTHPLADFGNDRDRWILERDIACRPLRAPISAATLKSTAALKALYAAQQTALRSSNARSRIAVRWLEMDRVATDSLRVWDAAFAEREALGRLIVRGDGSDVAGRGHWSRSAALGTSVSLTAETQRKAAAIITKVVPRDAVLRIVATSTAPKA